MNEIAAAYTLTLTYIHIYSQIMRQSWISFNNFLCTKPNLMIKVVNGWVRGDSIVFTIKSLIIALVI